MIELLTILVVLIGGSLLVKSLGINGWVVPAFGFIIGLCLMILIGAAQVIIPALPYSPVMTVVLTFILPALYWTALRFKGQDIKINLFMSALVIIIAASGVLFLRQANLVNWHIDSFFYLGAATLIVNDNYHDYAVESLTDKRLLAVPLMHAPAHLSGELYLRSVVPLLSLSLLAVFAWLFKEGCQKLIRKKDMFVYWLAIGLLLLLTNNRFIYHSFYLNSHLFFAALLLIIAGSGWLIARKSNVSISTLISLQAIVTPALIITRPEAFLVASLALLPTLLSRKVPWRQRMLLLSVLGFSTAIWHGFVAYFYYSRGSSVMLSVYAPLVLGVIYILAAPILKWRYLLKSPRFFLRLTEISLWVAVLAATLLNPLPTINSVNSILHNLVLGEGVWGLSLLLLFILLSVALVLIKAPEQIYLRFPLTSFIPLAFLLAYMRGGGYRIGHGDSLNRMFMQIVPLLVLFIIVSAASGRWRSWKLKTEPEGFNFRKIAEALYR